MVILYLDAVIIVTCRCLRLAMIWMILFMQRPFIHPYAYSILILLFTTIIAIVVFISLLLLLYYCHCYKTVATDKPLRASLLSGAAELTTHLWLINILWPPCVESINLGFTSFEDCCDPLYLWVINHRPYHGAEGPDRSPEAGSLRISRILMTHKYRGSQ